MKQQKFLAPLLGKCWLIATCCCVCVMPYGHAQAQNIPVGPSAVTRDRPLLPLPPVINHMPPGSPVGGGAPAVPSTKLASATLLLGCSSEKEQIAILDKLTKAQKDEIERLNELLGARKRNTTFSLEGGSRK